MEDLNPGEMTEPGSAELQVGRKVRELRTLSGFSLRMLAEKSGLNINTLSKIENGRTSATVGTLQSLAMALCVPVAAFFPGQTPSNRAIFTPRFSRPGTHLGLTYLENLGSGLASEVIQPYIVTLKPGGSSGERMMKHSGLEFVYCLEGKVGYRLDYETFTLNPGDSLLFLAETPHFWHNLDPENSKVLLILCPNEQHQELQRTHFESPDMLPPAGSEE